MKKKQFQTISILIVMAILVISLAQGYWMLTNYQENKQLILSDLQAILDESIQDYYVSNTRESFGWNSMIDEDQEGDSIFIYVDEKFDTIRDEFIYVDEKFDTIRDEKGFFTKRKDSINIIISDNKGERSPLRLMDTLKNAWSLLDTINPERIEKVEIQRLASSIFISIKSDSINYQKLDSLLSVKMKQRGLPVDYRLHVCRKEGSCKPSLQGSSYLTATNNLVPEALRIHLSYKSLYSAILQQSLLTLLLAFTVILFISLALIFLYRVIARQKHLAEIKNDLINNITHEFKTPIATVLTALESLQHFSGADDQEKRKRYLSISENQLAKLNVMVEKLLETASLDSDKISLQLEEVSCDRLIQGVLDRFRITIKDKGIILHTKLIDVPIKVDVFHFENAISNLLDNAIKYGGNEILVTSKKAGEKFSISIWDSGKQLSPSDKNRIFEKFYRVPTGNLHNTKGYGIGLYYTRKIIEKHGGTIHVSIDQKGTTFSIEI